MSILLTPEVIVLLVEDILLFVFNTIAIVIAYNIQKNFNINETSQRQYLLEKRTYLATYIIKFSLYIKIFSSLFFIYSLDKFSNIIPGAMCAVGVTSSSDYGFPLLLLKLINIYLYGLWLVINKQDTNRENFPFTKIKFKYFIFIYIFFIAEILLQYIYLFDINTQELVNCCSTVFNEENISITGKLINIPEYISLTVFYLLYIILLFSSIKKIYLLNGIANLLFLIVSIITLIGFFGTYIYELPTHHCPFCLLQKDYNFIGYFLYFFLILGTFLGIANAVLKQTLNIKLDYFKKSLIFNSVYLVIVSFYPINYYLINRVWL